MTPSRTLSRIEPHSPTWRAVVAWAEEQIEQAQRRLEAHGLTEAVTEYERGKIAALRRLLADGKPVPAPPTITSPLSYLDG